MTRFNWRLFEKSTTFISYLWLNHRYEINKRLYSWRGHKPVNYFLVMGMFNPVNNLFITGYQWLILLGKILIVVLFSEKHFFTKILRIPNLFVSHCFPHHLQICDFSENKCCKMYPGIMLPPGVNFTNILRAAFLYECFFVQF
jgi:hypothetical protein